MEKSIDANKLIREISSIFILFICLFLFISLCSYSPKDPSFNVAVSTSHIRNWGGIVGAYVAGLVVEFLGCVSWSLPLLFLWAGISGIFGIFRIKWFRLVGFLLIFLFLSMFFGSPWGKDIPIGTIHGGGYIGNYLFSFVYHYLSLGGTLLLWAFLIILGIQLMLLFLWRDIFKYIVNIVFLCIKWLGKLIEHIRALFPKHTIRRQISKASNPVKKKVEHEKQDLKHEEIIRELPLNKHPFEKKKEPQDNHNYTTLKYPSTELLDEVPDQRYEVDQKLYEQMSSKLIACLKDFGVEGDLINIKPGPVVTMFEFRPAPGIKISKIAQLSSDLALAMKAIAVRIEAPIPGKDYIGIEIPNKKRKVVYFREIIETDVFKRFHEGLPIVLGTDIQGNPRVEDLSKMPHLLVAGATGAGKSVCLNSIIISLLMRFSPEDVKFLLIDPKRIEMASYSGLPHLIHPVVTDMGLAKTSLEWAVFEMEERYDLMAKVGVRNIRSFNNKVKKGEVEEDIGCMPYLVLIIDEMADLMLTVGKEAESYIIRLAQLARAAGIHLILATQRPSVDVVTGLIKANFPARIGFQVTSKHDSRTILDTVGAEHLLGKGDMLFKPPAGRIQRIHGAYISDGEINRVIEFWETKFPKKEHLDLNEWKLDKAQESKVGNNNDIIDDPMYQDAVNFVMEQGKVSISMLQRYLRIGFNRAARFVEQMEQDGIIGPQEGSKPRVVIKK